MATEGNSKERFLIAVKEIRLCFEEEMKEVHNEVQELRKHLDDRRKYFEDLLGLKLLKPCVLTVQNDRKIEESETDSKSEGHSLQDQQFCEKDHDNVPGTPESPALYTKLYAKEDLKFNQCPESPVLSASSKRIQKPVSISTGTQKQPNFIRTPETPLLSTDAQKLNWSECEEVTVPFTKKPIVSPRPADVMISSNWKMDKQYRSVQKKLF